MAVSSGTKGNGSIVWIPICFRQCTDISLLMGVINFGTLTAAKSQC